MISTPETLAPSTTTSVADSLHSGEPVGAVPTNEGAVLTGVRVDVQGERPVGYCDGECAVWLRGAEPAGASLAGPGPQHYAAHTSSVRPEECPQDSAVAVRMYRGAVAGRREGHISEGVPDKSGERRVIFFQFGARVDFVVYRAGRIVHVEPGLDTLRPVLVGVLCGVGALPEAGAQRVPVGAFQLLTECDASGLQLDAHVEHGVRSLVHNDVLMGEQIGAVAQKILFRYRQYGALKRGANSAAP